MFLGSCYKNAARCVFLIGPFYSIAADKSLEMCPYIRGVKFGRQGIVLGFTNSAGGVRQGAPFASSMRSKVANRDSTTMSAVLLYHNKLTWHSSQQRGSSIRLSKRVHTVSSGGVDATFGSTHKRRNQQSTTARNILREASAADTADTADTAPHLRQYRPHALVHESLVRLFYDGRQCPVIVQEKDHLSREKGTIGNIAQCRR